MSTPSTTQTTPRKTRIARYFLPSINPDSVLLPDDRWIISSVKAIVKASRQLQKDLKRTGIFAGLAVTALAIGITGIFLAGTPLLMAGIGMTALAGAGFCAKKTADSWQALKKNNLPALRSELTARFFKWKGAQLADAWKERAALKTTQRPDPEKTASPKKTVPPEKIAEKTTDSSLAFRFSGWALKKILKKAQTPKDPPKPPQP